MKFILILLLIIQVNFSQTENILDVTKFGADPSAVKKSSDAIKRAIDEAYSKGGGTLHFPKGEYIVGPIHLKSNITLDLAEDTVIKFTTDFDDYLPMVPMRWEGTVLINFSPLIYAYEQQNITIRGKGILDGQGAQWWKERDKLKLEYSNNGTRNTKYQKEFLRLNNLTEIKSETIHMSKINLAFLRPPFIQPFNSSNILIEDITVKNSPFWNINPVLCENVTIRGVKIQAPVPSPNTDGIDPDSCKNVLITNVEFDVGDDCIAIKSGRDLQGRKIGKPTENVMITNCKMLRGISGVAIGSEQSGGIRNVTVKDCVFDGTDRGFYIKSTRGRGGIVEHIEYKNVSMTRIKHETILITMAYGGGDDPHKVQPFSERTPVFRNIKFENIKSESQTSVVMSGIPESLLDNIELKNVEITSKHGFTANYTKNLKIMGFSQKLTDN